MKLTLSFSLLLIVLVHGAAGQGQLGDDSHWSSHFAPPLIERVVDIAADERDVFLAGHFRVGRKSSTRAVLRVDPVTGSYELIGELILQQGKPSDGIFAIAATEAHLFVTGDFDLGYGERFFGAWSRQEEAWIEDYPNPPTRTDLIAVDGEDVYVVAHSYAEEGRWTSRILAQRDDGWSQVGDDISGDVLSIAAAEGVLYLSHGAGTSDHAEFRIVRREEDDWEVIGTTGSGTVSYVGLDAEGQLLAAGPFVNLDGVETGNVARWDGARWAPAGNDPLRGLGLIWVLAVDPENTVYAPGGTTILRLRDGSWETLPGKADLGIMRLAVGGDDVYVAGNFDVVGDVVAARVVAWDSSAERWKAVVNEDPGGINGFVRTMAVGPDGDVYVGGRFSSAGRAAARNVARWDGLRWWPVGGGLEGFVYGLVWYGSELVAHGILGDPANQEHARLARWTPSADSWEYLVRDDSGRRLSPLTMASVEGKLYAGGSARDADGTETSGLFSWDGSEWALVSEARLGQHPGYIMQIVGGEVGELFVGGSFDHIGGVPAGGVARWDGSEWTGLREDVVPELVVLAHDAGFLYAGSFNDDSLRIWSSRSREWTASSADLRAGPGCDVGIHAITIINRHVAVGGGTAHCIFNQKSASGPEFGLRLWDGDAWLAPGSGIEGTVYALATTGDDLFVGGSFERAGGRPSFYFAQWNEVDVLPAEQPNESAAFALESIYPNPCHHSTTIRVDLPLFGHLRVAIFDLLGREVAWLVDREMPAGRHEFHFEAAGLPSGIYLVGVEALGRRDARKMVLVR